MPKIKLDLNIDSRQTNSLLQTRVNAEHIKPELVEPSEIRKPDAYKRFLDLDLKSRFRTGLLNQLKSTWAELYGESRADALAENFKHLASILEENGALIFGDIINKKAFQTLISQYESVLQNSGSKSWIHSYINLGNHPDFLSNKAFNGAFLHSLLIALVAFRIGGPIRIVDARGKDAQPISVLAQDNMLHIDNTPFNDEYKIILSWEKGKASGPKGQNFVYVPGTHKGARNCFVSPKGEAWSTESGSIFITPDSIQQVFSFQQKIRSEKRPTVVEAHHRDKPLTTIFPAGSLIHHRYRTEQGYPRSCMILAFHLAKDNPGQFMAPVHVQRISQKGDLNSFLFGYHGSHTEDQFVQAIVLNAQELAFKMDEINSKDTGVEIVEQKLRELSNDELWEWRSNATQAPTVEELKIQEHFFPLEQTLLLEDFINLLANKMMMFDKHGPLDLILYGDSHEEIRKWARNRIREMKMDRLNTHLQNWGSFLSQPEADHLLTPQQLKEISERLITYIDKLGTQQKANAIIDVMEKISSQDAYRSVRQLIDDLGESIMRCNSRQTFLSTSLFLFWACNELCSFCEKENNELMEMGKQLLRNYIATAILVEKQIKEEMFLLKGPIVPGRLQDLFTGNLTFFKLFEKSFLMENRDCGDSKIRRAYDERFGLVPRAVRGFFRV